MIATVDLSEEGDIIVDSNINDTHLVVSWEFINNIITFFTVSPYSSGIEYPQKESNPPGVYRIIYYHIT